MPFRQNVEAVERKQFVSRPSSHPHSAIRPAITTNSIARCLHSSPTSKDCAQCHQGPPSHYMEHSVMMDKMITGQERATVNQRFLCHRTDSFNDIKDFGWYKAL